jgi:hypothetical protein
MAKKKKAATASSSSSKRGGSDARGYATTNASNKHTALSSVPAASPTWKSSGAAAAAAAVTTSIATAPLSKTNSRTVTSTAAASSLFTPQVYDILQELIALLQSFRAVHSDAVSQASPFATSSSSSSATGLPLRRRVEKLYHALTHLGFGLDHIRAAAAAGALSTGSVPTALDWLCEHVESTELPRLFVEAWVHNADTMSSNAPYSSLPESLVVIRPTISANSTTTLEEKEASFWPAPPRSSLEGSVPLVADDDDEAAAAAAAARSKAWLLQQYQYEVDDDDLEEEHADAPIHNLVQQQAEPERTEPLSRCDSSLHVAVVADPVHSANVDSVATEPTTTIDVSTRDNEAKLQQWRVELSELEADVANPANNYMRSKLEIKQLQQHVKKLRQQVQGLERTLERRRHTSRPLEPNAAATPNASTTRDTAAATPDSEPHPADADPVLTNNDEEDDGLGALFDGLDENDASAATDGKDPAQPMEPPDAEEALEDKDHVPIPKDSIPSTWTGKTPRAHLEEWCRKEKVKPNFQKLPQYGCRLTIDRKKGGAIVVTEAGPHANYSDVQHYVATKALYQIDPTLPLYRLFPPYHRTLWLQWQRGEHAVQEQHETALAESRRTIVDEIMQCLPTGTRQGMKVSSATATPPPPPVASPLPVETNDSDAAMKANDSWDDETPSVPEISKSLSARVLCLQESYQRRRASTRYQNMWVDRTSLPIYAYREQILETIRLHPVTILCAETGTCGKMHN